MKTTTLIFLAVLSSISSLFASEMGSKLIDKPGEYPLDSSGSAVAISLNEDGELSLNIEWKYTNRFGNDTSSSVSPNNELIAPGWFVFVETPRRIWIFDGVRAGTLFKQSRFASSIEAWNGRNMVYSPDGVLDSLPSDIRDYWTAEIIEFLSDRHRNAP